MCVFFSVSLASIERSYGAKRMLMDKQFFFSAYCRWHIYFRHNFYSGWCFFFNSSFNSIVIGLVVIIWQIVFYMWNIVTKIFRNYSVMWSHIPPFLCWMYIYWCSLSNVIEFAVRMPTTRRIKLAHANWNLEFYIKKFIQILIFRTIMPCIDSWIWLRK